MIDRVVIEATFPGVSINEEGSIIFIVNIRDLGLVSRCPLTRSIGPGAIVVVHVPRVSDSQKLGYYFTTAVFNLIGSYHFISMTSNQTIVGVTTGVTTHNPVGTQSL